MGFVVPQTGAMGFLTSHLLTLLLLLPFLVAVVAFAMRVTDYAGEEKLRGLTLLSTGGMCLLAIAPYQGFDGSVTRGDGNEGFQFVERSVLASSVGVEYYVGVDGANVAFVLLTALVGFAGAIAAHRVTADAGRRLTTFYGLYGLLLTGTMGVFVSLDLVLFTGSWACHARGAHSAPLRGRRRDVPERGAKGCPRLRALHGALPRVRRGRPLSSLLFRTTSATAPASRTRSRSPS